MPIDEGEVVDGNVNWAKGCFHAGRSQGIIMYVTHISGVSVDISHHKLNGDFKIHYNWSDHKAVFVLAPLPPVPLHSFFGEGVGPNRFACKQMNAAGLKR